MPHPTFEEKLEEILDAHAILYSRTTKQYILDEISIEERDKEWNKSDLKAKVSILAAHKEEVERVIGEDDYPQPGYRILTLSKGHRNELRKEQRQRAGLGSDEPKR